MPSAQFNRFAAMRSPSEDRDLIFTDADAGTGKRQAAFRSPRLHELLRREELVHNHKRTERISQEENLSLRTRKRVKRPSHARIVQAGPAGPDEQWAMDVVNDSLMGGRRIRILTIADLWDRSGFTSLDQSTAKLRWTVSLVMPPI